MTRETLMKIEGACHCGEVSSIPGSHQLQSLIPPTGKACL